MSKISDSSVVLKVCLLVGIALSVTWGVSRYFHSDRGFTVSYTGSLEGEFTGPGDFVGCAQSNDSPFYSLIRLQDDRMMNWIVINLPPSISPGTYRLSAAAARGTTYNISATISQSSGDFQVFSSANLTVGQITLDAVPRAPGKTLRGSFDAQFYDGTDSISVTGSFNFEAGSGASYACME